MVVPYYGHGRRQGGGNRGMPLVKKMMYLDGEVDRRERKLMYHLGDGDEIDYGSTLLRAWEETMRRH
ncbi:hypothetical protein Tco_0913788 [Tanacetum coccineum]